MRRASSDRHATRSPLIQASERRDDLLGTLLGVVGAATGVVSLLGREWRRMPDYDETRLLYQRAADVGRDRANADTALVADRLSPLVAAPDGPRGDELVLSAARRLVHWVADGRAEDVTMAETEAAFARLADARDSEDHPAGLDELIERYVDAWATTLQA